MVGFTLRTLTLRRARSWSPDRVAALQDARLRALLRHTVEHSAFYREKYRGIDIDRCSLGDLPTTDKTELMAHFDDAVTDPRIRRRDLEAFLDDPANEGVPFLGEYAASHTSGSQGQPMLMVQGRRQVELFFGLQMTRGNVRKPTPIEALRRLVSPARLAVVTLKKGFYPSASLFEYMPDNVRRFIKLLWLSQTDPDLVERLNAFRPTALTAYAGVLDQLAEAVEAGRLSLAPELEQVTNNSEELTERARQRFEAAFGLSIINNYATGECPFLTNGCHTDRGAHVNADWAILEVVDEHYRPVPAGTPGRKVLITNLANTAQPFIRYEIGDVVTMADKPCRCGSRLPRVERIDGRAADSFWVRDGQTHRLLINSVFKNAFDYIREVREWQAIQHSRNGVLLRVELLPGETLNEPRAWGALDRQLALYGFQGLIDLRMEVVPRIDADPSTGKTRRIISLIGAPREMATGRLAS
jgi:phenylacetate-coenzyme A ligase PaaK-like adenylate-forming protein